MATSLIPPLNTKGIYTLRDPWVSDLTRVYTCIGIQRFAALAAKNIDVFSTYYAPKQLTRADYDTDAALGAAILTLASDTSEPIYIPSTYLVSYPNMSTVNYYHTVLSVSLGELYAGIALEGAIEQIQNTVEGVIGVTPTVLVHVAPTQGVVTPEQHQTIEANRQAAITNNTTNTQLLLQKDATIAELQAKVAILTKVCQDNGWIGNG